MEQRCEYCGNLLTGQEKTCPSCGAPVPFASVPIHDQNDPAESKKPKTIAELQAFAKQHNLPLKKMRVFIGEDCREPRAFGVFQESENSFVVYKNKADGSRAVRYRGPDEARAVRELYDKMHDMVKQQKAFQTSTGTARPSGSTKSRGGILGWFQSLPKIIRIGIVLLIVFFLCAALFGKAKRRGYYHYNDNYYYQQNGSWYVYQDYDWVPSVIDHELSENYGNYYSGSGYNSSYGIGDFSDSDYYVEPAQNYGSGSGGSYSSDNDDGWSWDDNDSDWDWDSDDDWDWGGGDWDDIGDWDSDW